MKIKTLLIAIATLFLLTEMSLLAQDTVTVNAQIQGHLTFILDATDPGQNLNGGDYTVNETSNIGMVDAGGTATAGGDATIVGIAGLPVDAGGNDLSAGDGFFDPNCIGAFYPFLEATGGSNPTQHPNTAMGIYARGSRVNSYDLSTTAVVVGDPSVSVGQLKWKDDGTASPGSTGYTDFSGVSVSIASGGVGGFRLLLFHDMGLSVEFDDAPGNYTWTITYTLTTT